MNTKNILPRIYGKYQRTLSGLMYRRPITMRNSAPCISFTFDDFPRSSLHRGGDILTRFGLRATYYASLGLMGTEAPPGAICLLDDIIELIAQGHELGCHTFDHCHSWETNPSVFEKSIIKNGQVLNEIIPGSIFRTFAYPSSYPRPDTKLMASKYFSCCRCGGQAFNAGIADMNLLKAYLLEKSRDNLSAVKEVIDLNCQAGGWLIFATHDISENPTPYGCTPAFFEEIVGYSQASGAEILPVSETLAAITGTMQSESLLDVTRSVYTIGN